MFSNAFERCKFQGKNLKLTDSIPYSFFSIWALLSDRYKDMYIKSSLSRTYTLSSSSTSIYWLKYYCLTKKNLFLSTSYFAWASIFSLKATACPILSASGSTSFFTSLSFFSSTFLFTMIKLASNSFYSNVSSKSFSSCFLTSSVVQ